MIQQFNYFFQYEKERPDIGFIGGMYESLRDMVSDIKPKKVALKVNIKEIPFDIRFYIDTIDIFYELSRSYGTNKYLSTEFHLQLGMWYWNSYNYQEYQCVAYSHINVLRQYKKKKEVLWEEVKKALFDYWLEISTNKEL